MNTLLAKKKVFSYATNICTVRKMNTERKSSFM